MKYNKKNVIAWGLAVLLAIGQPAAEIMTVHAENGTDPASTEPAAGPQNNNEDPIQTGEPAEQDSGTAPVSEPSEPTDDPDQKKGESPLPDTVPAEPSASPEGPVSTAGPEPTPDASVSTADPENTSDPETAPEGTSEEPEEEVSQPQDDEQKKTGAGENETPGEEDEEDSDEAADDGGTDEPEEKGNLLGAPAPGRVPAIKEETLNDTGEVVRTVAIAVSKRTPDEEGIYQLKTGQNMTYTIAVGNEGNVEIEDAVRIYFDFSGQGYEYGIFPPSDTPYTLRNLSGTEYTMSVVQCVDGEGNPMPGKFYYELTGIKPGETLSFQNDMFYPSPSSAGGGLKMWTKTITQGSPSEPGEYIEPGQYIELNWTTAPESRTVTKALATSRGGQNVTPYYVGDGTGGDKAYLKNFGYVIRENASGTSTGEGQDLIRSVDYSDTLTLPLKGTEWREGVIEAIENGNVQIVGEQVASSFGASSGSYYWGYSVYATVGGQRILVCQLADSGYSSRSNYTSNGSIKNLKASVVTDVHGNKTIRLDWKNDNPYKTNNAASREYPAKTFSLTYGNEVLVGSIEELSEVKEEGGLPTFSNHVEETRHYSWSADQTSTADTNTPIRLDEKLTTSKFWNSGSDYNSVYGGTTYPFTLRMENTGLVNLKNWGEKNADQSIKTPMITDTLDFRLYIKPEDLEKMFNARKTVGSDTFAVGDWLTVEINPASLFTVNEGRELEYGHELYAEDDANPTDKYQVGSRPAKDGSLITNKAKIVLKKVDGVLTVTVSNSGAAGKDGTYTIDGTNYRSLNDLFRKIGFMTTRDAIYRLAWQPGENEYTLKSGQRLNIDVPSSFKTSFMMMTDDNQNSHSESNYFRNMATFTSTYAGSLHKDNRYTNYRYWTNEVYLSKSGTTASGGSINQQNVTVADGDVIDYQIYGTVYPTLNLGSVPFTDLIVGAQIALADKSVNPELKAPDGTELESITKGGKDYWILNKPGTYENVKFGQTSKNGTTYHTAETITVTAQGKSGLRTLIKWQPEQNFGSSSNRSKSYWYKTLVSAEKSGMVIGTDVADLTFSFDNKAWMGEHQKHRLYATLQKVFYIFRYSNKHILLDPEGSLTDNENLAQENRINRNQTVTYLLKVDNSSDFTATVRGNQIYDSLPQTRGVFDWTKVNVTNLRYEPEGNARVYMVNDEGAEIDHWDGKRGGSWQNGTGDSTWSIGNTTPTSGSVTPGQQYLRWDNNFRMDVPGHGKVYILVDLTFPADTEDGATWSRYVSENNGAYLYNHFYIRDQNTWFSSYVRHLPMADVEAVLRKGVYDTGWTTKDGRSSIWGYQYNSRRSRQTYVNSGDTNEQSSNLHAATVTYYTEVYNGGNERLYLEDLQDLLPKGFTFNSMANVNYNSTTDWDNWSTSRGYSGFVGRNRIPSMYMIYTEGNNSGDSDRLATVDNSIDAEDNRKPVYVNAKVTASTQSRNGRTYLTFRVTNEGATNYSAHPAISYDADAKRYYLNPGEALRFGYNVICGTFANTEELATNTITMPFYNYYGTEFTLDDYKKLKPSTRNGLTANDGECDQMSADQVKDLYGFNTNNYTGPAYATEEDGNWLVSSVSLTRAEMVPGIQKAVGGYTTGTSSGIQGSRGSNSGALYGTAYTGGIKSSDIVNWRVRVFSDNNTMFNYRLVETADAPYKFTGEVFFNGYRRNGNSDVNETGSQYLFTLGNRMKGDTTVKIESGSSTNPDKTLKIGKADDDSDDQWFTFGTGINAGRVKIENLDDGREQMTIELTGLKYAVAENRHLDYCLHTKFCDDVIVICDGKYNDVILKPAQDYRTSAVSQGRPLTHKETVDGETRIVNDGIEAGASVMLVQGYTTSSNKTITEIGNTSNFGNSDTNSGKPNQITLSQKDKAVRYDLYITGPKANMSRVVLIDALPEPGDHSAFVASDKRNSAFTVGLLADNPAFSVGLAKKNQAEKKLNADQYTIEISTRTDFVKGDWEGSGTGWQPLAEATEEDLKNARSFRIIINDPQAWQTDSSKYMMPDETNVHVSFNACINDENAEPGQVAWNSFGYEYTVPQTYMGTEADSIGISLTAQPLNVGLRYPGVPEVTKKLIDEDGNARKAEKDLQFRFLIYKGEPIFDLDRSLNMEEAEIAEVLDNAGRDYIIVPAEIKAGESTVTVRLFEQDWPLAAYAEGWTEKEVPEGQEGFMRWLNGQQYTVLELPVGEYRYALDSINQGYNNVAFTQDAAESAQLVITNRYEPMHLEIAGKKVWEDEDDYDLLRPETITVRLLADGEEAASVETDAEQDWAWRFENLTITDETGKIIEYEVKEDEVEGYTTQITEEDPVDTEDGQTRNFTITNKHEIAMTDFTVRKVWEDAADQDGRRPDTITVQLKANRENYGPEVTLSARNQWTYTWQDLYVYEQGEKINYTVDEVKVPDGYQKTGIELSGSAEEGYEAVITNTHEPLQTKVTVTKVWEDADDKDHLRPQTIKVSLLADGKETGETAELNEKNQWKYTWQDLDAYAGGKEIRYTVQESEVPEKYEVSYGNPEGSPEKGWSLQVTNTHKPKAPPVPRPLVPFTSDPFNPLFWGGLMAVSLGVTAVAARIEKKHR